MTTYGERLRAALLATRKEGIRGFGAASARRSDGYEFAELRGYVEGDDPRRIDWAATARAGSLQSRVMLEERSLSLAAVVDASESMHVGRTRSNYDLACEAAALWYACALDDDRCSRVGERALLFRHARGRTSAAACSREREARGSSFVASLRLALATLPRGTRLLVASDFFDVAAVVELIRACASRFDCTALVLRDPWYDGFPLEGFVRLRDAETGAVARVFVGRRGRERYRRATAERDASVRETLRRAGARIAVLAEGVRPETAFAQALGFG